MAVSDQRLSLFALISEFEADARDIIANYICGDYKIIDDLGAESYKIISERARKNFVEDDLDDKILLNFLDLGDAVKIILSNRSRLPKSVATALTKSIKHLEIIPSIRNRVMHRRPIEFDDLPLVTDFSRLLVRIAPQQFDRLSKVLSDINNEDSLKKFSKSFSYDSEPTVLNNLPQPDFEDTGFMGRREQVSELKKAISGPYPVITVLGIGGAGKSALALHVAYDILNDPSCDFDAIIWTTAKTTRLTGVDVENISNAISSSVGIAEKALKELGEVPASDPFLQVKELLSNFKILLFIDNLETILDEKLRYFVRDMPQGSKIVFTSRIGLGAFDFVIPIRNLATKEAENYFRRVALVWKQHGLLSKSKDEVISYLARLNNSPLGIKWFVQAVASGASAQKLLANPASLLIFCLENIIENMSEEAKATLIALGVTGREQSPASLHFITNIEPWSVEDALRELIGSHLITVVTSKFGEEDRYKIAPIVQTYLSKLHAPAANIQAEIRGRQAQLVQMSERAEAEKVRGFVYDPFYISVRVEYSGTDAVAANYLRRALNFAGQGHYEEAFAEIENAKLIAPSFFEVMRVEAFISANQGNTMRAQHAYEEAVALKSDHPPLLILYAGFLMRCLGDGATAEEIMRRALDFDESAPELRMELARTLMYQHGFDESWNILRGTNAALLKNGRSVRMYHDLLIQTCVRSATNSLAAGSAQGFSHSIDRLKLVLTEMPSYAVDQYIKSHLREALIICRKFLRIERDSPNAKDVDVVIKSISAVIDEDVKDSYSDSTQFKGRIDTLSDEKKFGFIEGDDGRRLFFHKNNLNNSEEFAKLFVGCFVYFSIGRNNQGECADEVYILSA